MKNKYCNIKIEIDGIKFASKHEGQTYLNLLLLQRAGKISNLQWQVKFELQPKFTKTINDKKINHKSINYIADFTYTDLEKGNCVMVIDCKGSKKIETEVYRIKKKMFEFKYPGLSITEIYKN